jgi:hypothetical protein
VHQICEEVAEGLPPPGARAGAGGAGGRAGARGPFRRAAGAAGARGAAAARLRGGGARARSHARFVPPLIHFMPDSRTYSVPLYLKRQCDRTPGGGVAPRRGGAEGAGGDGRPLRAAAPAHRAGRLARHMGLIFHACTRYFWPSMGHGMVGTYMVRYAPASAAVTRPCHGQARRGRGAARALQPHRARRLRGAGAPRCPPLP